MPQIGIADKATLDLIKQTIDTSLDAKVSDVLKFVNASDTRKVNFSSFARIGVTDNFTEFIKEAYMTGIQGRCRISCVGQAPQGYIRIFKNDLQIATSIFSPNTSTPITVDTDFQLGDVLRIQINKTQGAGPYDYKIEDAWIGYDEAPKPHIITSDTLS